MLEKDQRPILVERSTSKSPLTDGDVRALISRADRVVIARGRTRREVVPGDVGLDDLKGPTGNYRAPILLAGGTLLVGFNEAALSGL